ncbi:MAG: TetR family transcriptional regulator [Pseudobdellovibrio sp.]|nr:TetR family transcriptional regulator [Pseudobdellovibrio sp.]
MSAKINSKQDAKKCILESAAKLFSKLGLDKTSTRDISKESHANISLISYHFGGKEGLYREVIREFALKVRDKVQPSLTEFKNQQMSKELFRKEVETMIDNMIEMRTAHPEISVILAREKIEGMPLCKEVHEEIFYPMIQNFFEMFKAAQAKGIIKPGLHPALFFILLSEGVFGFFELMDCETKINRDCAEFIKDKDLLKQQVVDIFLNGVLV